METLKQLIQLQRSSLHEQWNDNVAAGLFGIKLYGPQSSDNVEDELLKALKDKYDAVKEKIFEEALKA